MSRSTSTGPRGRAGRPLLLVAPAMTALLVGCSTVWGPTPSAPPPSSPVASSPAAPGSIDGAPDDDGSTTGAAIHGREVLVTSGGVTVSVLGQGVTQTRAPDGSVTVTAAVPAEATRVAAITVDEELVAAELGDGSVVLRDLSGVPVGGLSTPQLNAPPLDAPGSLAGTSVRAQVSADAIDLIVTPASTSTALTVSVRLGSATITSTAWGEREGGRSLAVVPTDWLRGGSLAAQEVAWAQLVTLVPEADTAIMRDQFDCHALGARDKASWNFEPWRPDVGALAVLAARCNPT